MKKGSYEHEMDRPSVPKHGHQMSGMGVDDMKKEAMDIAYGQAGEKGCKSDSKKISGQMKHYDWESPSEY
jgi:hypothetical protein